MVVLELTIYIHTQILYYWGKPMSWYNNVLNQYSHNHDYTIKTLMHEWKITLNQVTDILNLCNLFNLVLCLLDQSISLSEWSVLRCNSCIRIHAIFFSFFYVLFNVNAIIDNTYTSKYYIVELSMHKLHMYWTKP